MPRQFHDWPCSFARCDFRQTNFHVRIVTGANCDPVAHHHFRRTIIQRGNVNDESVGFALLSLFFETFASAY
jgi:hypothetical protein